MTAQNTGKSKKLSKTEAPTGGGALLDAKGRLESIIEAIHVGTWEWNVQTGETVFNEVWAEIVGYTLEELAPINSMTWETLAHPDDIKRAGELLRRHFEGKLPYFDCETRMKHKDGHWVWVHDRGRVITRTDGGKPLMMFGTHTDITERKQAEALIEERRESEERHRDLLDNLQVAVVEHSADTSILFCNRQALKLLGLERDEATGSIAADPRWIFHREDGTAMPLEEFPVVQVLNTLEPLKSHFMGVEQPDSHEIRWVLVDAYPQFDEEKALKTVLVTFLDITERKRAEEALERSERLLADTGKMGKVGGWELNIDDGKLTWTEETCHIHEVDLSYEPILGQGIDFYSPASRPIIERAVQRAIEHGEPYDVELEIITAKGNLRTVHAIGKADLEHRRVYGFFQDITERKQAEEEVRRSEERSRSVLDATPFPVAVVDLQDDVIHFWSQSAQDLFGHTAPTAAEWYQIAYPDPDYRREVVARWKPYLEMARESRGTVNTGEYRVSCRDGSVRVCEIYATFLSDILIITFNDITERREAEAELTESRDLFANLASLVPGVIYQYRLWPDGRSTFPYSSPGMWDVYEVTPEEVKEDASPVFGRLHPDDLDLVSEAIQESARTLKTFYSEYRVILPEQGLGWRWSQAQPERTEDGGTLWHGIILDSSEIKRAEEERSKLEAQLTQAQKLESVGRLAGGVAHDFNNMLSVILGYTDMALSGMDPSDPLYPAFNEIEQAGNRSAELTRQLLTFARKQIVAPKVLYLNDVSQSMLAMLRRLIGEDIDLVWMPGADLWPVNMDPTQVDQLLANLCVNAMDAISGVGKVTIETGNVTLDEDSVAAQPDLRSGEFVMLAVSDDGCGMDDDTKVHIFEPFYTTKEVGKGTGLGLATVYGITKQNSGLVTVYSEVGEGTTFKIYLPRHVGDAEEATGSQPAAKPRGQGETVLLVEDEPTVLKVGSAMLNGLGYTVLTAGSPGEALALMAGHTGEIDLLMTDVVMPEMNGRDLAEKLQAQSPGLRCLFVSGYTANVIFHPGILNEGVQFLQKPFTASSLAVAVRQALGAG